jgi:hypothetical protein
MTGNLVQGPGSTAKKAKERKTFNALGKLVK